MSEQTVSAPLPQTGRKSRTAARRRNTVLLSNQAFSGASVRPAPAVATTAAESPHQVPVRSKWERRYSRNLLITDTVVVCGAVILAQYVRFGNPSMPPSYVNHYVTAYSALLAIIWLSTLAGFRSRSPRYIGVGIEEYRRVVTASFWTFGAIAMAELLVKLEISRGYLAVALPAGILGLVLSRYIWRIHLARRARRGPIPNGGVGHRGTDCGRESRERTDRKPEEWISGRGGRHHRLRSSSWRTPCHQRPGDSHHWWRNPRAAGDPYLRCRHSRDCRH